MSVPADAERELLSAGFDSVLSLHVRHLLRALTADHQDGVARTQVALCRLAAWCYLNVAFTHTYQPKHTQEKKRKEKSVISGVKLPVRKQDKKKGKK